MTTGGTYNSNIDSNNDPHDRILDRQSASILNTNDTQKQTIPPQKDSYDSTDHIWINPITTFERTKWIIMGTDALSQSP